MRWNQRLNFLKTTNYALMNNGCLSEELKCKGLEGKCDGAEKSLSRQARRKRKKASLK